MFAKVCRHTGWTFAQAEAELDLHRLQALNEEWGRLPPLDELVAAFMGVEVQAEPVAPDEPQDPAQATAAFERLFAQAGGVLG